MNFSQRSIIFLFAIFFFSCLETWAVTPTVREFTTYQDFLKGESSGIAISSDGNLMLGPGHTTLLDTDQPFVYSTVAGPQGTIYIGTGNDGKIFRHSATGSGELTTLEEPGVYALAIDSQNRLYAGTSPEGKVYRITEEGKAEIFFDPEEKFIWDLTFDKTGNLYVSTGSRGLVYKVDPSGKEETLFDSREAHIVTLELDLDGNLLAGSAPEGLLYRISTQGEPEIFTLLDSSLDEITSLAVDRYGIIYAAAVSGETRTTAQVVAAAATNGNDSGEEIEKVETDSTGKLQVYRVERNGLVRSIYASPTEMAFDISVRNDGSLILATGNQGRIIALDTKGFKTLLFECEEEQITCLAESGSDLYASTSNLGKLIRLEQEPKEQGEYLSEIIDAESTSKWGNISWFINNHSEPRGITFYTRSGNTARPNETWSKWSEPYLDASGNKITSPAGRYLQWKLVFQPEARGSALLADDNSIDSVSVTFQQHNLPPRLVSLKIHSRGIAFTKDKRYPPAGGTFPGGPEGAHLRSLPGDIRSLESPETVSPPRKVYIPASRTVSWKASDPNKDDLSYSLLISRVPGTEWNPLAEELTDTFFSLDGTSFEDGDYRVKIIASDLPSNPEDSALTDELVSKTFRISNSPPEIIWEKSPSSKTVGFSVKTGSNRLFRVEYSLDDKNWFLLFPDDGITDSREEHYRVEIPQEGRALRVRAIDDNGNVVTSTRTISQ